MKFSAILAFALATSVLALPSPLGIRDEQPADCGLGADLCTEVKSFGLGCCQKIDDLMIIVATTGDIWYGLWEQDHSIQSWEEYERRKNLLEKLKAHKASSQ
ncbi:hypothetical protein A1Q2_07814 [Trichosporon asahii var. asahii CBS 8904]|uniref:Hydrophobin n=2 Tax=Trichosporon asahii var. asahii TaxID=189963 RepID=K1VFF6_TRIAC|nr:hypothetical protein A1Q1_01738 [Trichosporon asahii var. asahii CBS 2479]EJT49089.1 hypothetical protein A1Q1_01738 [Trichosporon asahii var. asahii CBS 2479]EKC97811.1 hypothetical protein A1Q2_07814 [Trichosporon asahii var. asahii CBS 8904]